MKFSNLMSVTCIFIIYLFSSYACSMEAKIFYTDETEARYLGNAYAFKCPISCFQKSVWDMRFLSKKGKHSNKNKKHLVCCIKKDDLNIYVAEDHRKNHQCIVTYTGGITFDGLKLTMLNFKTNNNEIYTKPKCFLKAMIKFQLSQNPSTVSHEEKSFIGTVVNTVAYFAETKPILMFDYLTRDITKNDNPKENICYDEDDELIDVLLLLDSQTLEKNYFYSDNNKHQHANFICPDKECCFSDNIWENVYKHIKQFHPYKYPSIILSHNKRNHKMKELNILSQQYHCAPYISCQASLAHGIQRYIYRVISKGYGINYKDIMVYYIKPQYNVKEAFDELGYGSMNIFFRRHMMTLNPRIERSHIYF